ncbi:MAG TPA: histidine phosphatase family protein [Stellaceae bacterium]|nr:histidine phosphatase family protein [Stellaceae bacterium]
MKRLYLLRHAKAVPQEEGLADRDRALEKKGRRAAQAVAKWIEEQRPKLELALSSPSLRTRQTLEIVADAFPHPPKILFEDGLYLATARQLLARIHRLPETTESVMLVGHNPGFYELAAFLSDVAAGPLMARLGGFPTGALAGFETELPWAALERKRARLVTLALPKELMRAME